LGPRDTVNCQEHQSDQPSGCAHGKTLAEVTAARVRRSPHAAKRSCESCRIACGRSFIP
jgi:hypothetical protein